MLQARATLGLPKSEVFCGQVKTFEQKLCCHFGMNLAYRLESRLLMTCNSGLACPHAGQQGAVCSGCPARMVIVGMPCSLHLQSICTGSSRPNPCRHRLRILKLGCAGRNVSLWLTARFQLSAVKVFALKMKACPCGLG